MQGRSLGDVGEFNDGGDIVVAELVEGLDLHVGVVKVVGRAPARAEAPAGAGAKVEEGEREREAARDVKGEALWPLGAHGVGDCRRRRVPDVDRHEARGAPARDEGAAPDGVVRDGLAGEAVVGDAADELQFIAGDGEDRERFRVPGPENS